MPNTRNPWVVGSVLVAAGLLACVGCYHTQPDYSDYAQGPAPRRMPSPAVEAEAEESCSYEDSLTGGKVFAMYCGYCHNAPSLAERPFSNFQNVAAHMKVRANLTGKEYAKLQEFLRRWHDVPPPHPTEEPSPKRFVFSQPLNELRDKTDAENGGAPKQPEQLPPPEKVAPK
jgi:hypothetical protein